MTRQYYSTRAGKNTEVTGYSLNTLRRLFHATYRDFLQREHFQEMLGKNCVDGVGDGMGTFGHDAGAYIFRKLRKEKLWPVHEHIDAMSEDDIFDLIELFYDHVSVGTDGYDHDYSNCGWHYTQFDANRGKSLFRTAINEYLPQYSTGFELNQNGEVVHTTAQGLDSLLAAPTPDYLAPSTRERIDDAIRKIRARGVRHSDRRDAVRDLADVLESLRAQAKAVLTKRDEADLFNIANNFGIRHFNAQQKLEYDQDIWLSWMFYYYLATIHAVTRLIERANPSVLSVSTGN